MEPPNPSGHRFGTSGPSSFLGDRSPAGLFLVECGEGTTGATGSSRDSLSRRMTRTFIKMGAKNIIEDGAKRRAFSSL